MDIRYSTNPKDVKRYTTEELRKEFHITGLYQPDEVKAVYSHVDRMVTLGCMPVKKRYPSIRGSTYGPTLALIIFWNAENWECLTLVEQEPSSVMV